MTNFEHIKQKLSFIGEISDEGVSKFALDFNIEDGGLTDESKKKIDFSVDSFIKTSILHPTSVNENGFSTSWSADSIKSYRLMMLNKYEIKPNDETSALLGLNIIRDASDLW